MATRHKRGTGSVRFLPDSKRYQVRITGPDTKRYPIGTFATKGLAEGALSRELALIEKDPDNWKPPRERVKAKAIEQAQADAGRITFSEYAAEFVRTRVVKGQPLQPATKKRYEEIQRKYLNPWFGTIPLDQIPPALVAEWWEALPESPKIRKESYTHARAIMTQATSIHGPVAGKVNPFQIRGAGSGVSPKRETTATGTEIEIILDTIRPEWRAMVLLALWCGLRFGEIVELRRSDIDLSKGVIHVRRALGMAGSASKHVKAPKSEAGVRDQRIPASIIPDLRTHLRMHMNGRDGLVFPSPNGGHLNPSVFYGKPKSRPKDEVTKKSAESTPTKPKPVPGGWFAAREAAGRPDLRFHDLRATGATLLAESGAQDAEVQKFLGDSTPAAAHRYVRARSPRMDALTDALSKLAKGGKW